MNVTDLRVSTLTESHALLEIDVHGHGLDGGSRGELVHAISRPRCEHGPRQQRREPSAATGIPQEGARLSDLLEYFFECDGDEEWFGDQVADRS